MELKEARLDTNNILDSAASEENNSKKIQISKSNKEVSYKGICNDSDYIRSRRKKS
jgi:hypothetical protein